MTYYWNRGVSAATKGSETRRQQVRTDRRVQFLLRWYAARQNEASFMARLGIEPTSEDVDELATERQRAELLRWPVAWLQTTVVTRHLSDLDERRERSRRHRETRIDRFYAAAVDDALWGDVDEVLLDALEAEQFDRGFDAEDDLKAFENRGKDTPTGQEQPAWEPDDGEHDVDDELAPFVDYAETAESTWVGSGQGTPPDCDGLPVRFVHGFAHVSLEQAIARQHRRDEAEFGEPRIPTLALRAA